MSQELESKGFYKLSWLQRIGFGSGDLAQNLIFQTVACYLMLYLTTVLKINPDKSPDNSTDSIIGGK